VGLLLVILLLWPFPAPSQTNQPPDRWPIESLSVTGNSRYETGRILAASGLKVGQVAGKEDLEAARTSLMATGVFASIAYSYGPTPSNKGFRVTYEVIEAPDVYPFRFERLDASSKEMEDWLRRSDPLFSDRIPATQPVLKRYASAVEAFLASQGKKETVVGGLTPDDAGQMVVVFSPAAPPPSVAQVMFTGNTTISTPTLQNVMAGVAVGTLYTEARFRQVLEANIRPLYDAAGRIRVAFPKVTVEPAKDVQGVAVTVDIQEGEVYSLDKVKLDGAGLPEKELLRTADFKTGEVADFKEIDAGLDRMKKRLTRDGFMHPQTRVERTIRDAEKKVDIVVHVDPGTRYVFGKLSIEGLDLNGEAAVRKSWGMKPGAPFDTQYPDYFLGRVREDGLFDNLGKTKSAIRVDEQAHTVDVTLSFAAPEKPPRPEDLPRFPGGIPRGN
jgi:outer membrane protein insertion porin family